MGIFRKTLSKLILISVTCYLCFNPCYLKANSSSEIVTSSDILSTSDSDTSADLNAMGEDSGTSTEKILILIQKKAKLFAENFSPIDPPIFTLKQKYQDYHSNFELSFFEPQGFSLVLNHNYEKFKTNLNRTGHWQVLPSDRITDFSVRLLKINEAKMHMIQNALERIYKNEQIRPEYDSIVVFSNTPHNESKPLTEIIAHKEKFKLYSIPVIIRLYPVC